MFISISCLQLSHFAEISGPYIRWQHRLAGPSGVYYCGQTSLNYNTSTTPEELYWRTSSLDTVLHLFLSTCTVYKHFLSLTKSLPGWGDSPRSPPLQKKYGGHFVWCWLNEWWVQLCLYDCPYTKKNPPYAAERQLLLGAWPSFFRGHYSSCSWIYIKATDRIQQNSWK